MRTYGIDNNTGNWTLLSQTPFSGADNPLTSKINSTFGNTSSIVSTLYTVLNSFFNGTVSIPSGSVLLNDQIFDSNNNILNSTWTNITTATNIYVLSTVPLANNIAIQQRGYTTFFINNNLTLGEEIIVDVSYIWLATLAQTLRLNTNESPFYSNYGIPAQQSVQTQIAPTIAITTTQQQFAPYFATLSIYKQPNTVNPTYTINAVFLNGTTVQSVVAS